MKRMEFSVLKGASKNGFPSLYPSHKAAKSLEIVYRSQSSGHQRAPPVSSKQVGTPPFPLDWLKGGRCFEWRQRISKRIGCEQMLEKPDLVKAVSRDEPVNDWMVVETESGEKRPAVQVRCS
jgi:hypothetical protein